MSVDDQNTYVEALSKIVEEQKRYCDTIGWDETSWAVFRNEDALTLDNALILVVQLLVELPNLPKSLHKRRTKIQKIVLEDWPQGPHLEIIDREDKAEKESTDAVYGLFDSGNGIGIPLLIFSNFVEEVEDLLVGPTAVAFAFLGVVLESLPITVRTEYSALQGARWDIECQQIRNNIGGEDVDEENLLGAVGPVPKTSTCEEDDVFESPIKAASVGPSKIDARFTFPLYRTPRVVTGSFSSAVGDLGQSPVLQKSNKKPKINYTKIYTEDLKVGGARKVEKTETETEIPKQEPKMATGPTVLLGERKLPTFKGEEGENFKEFFEKFEVYKGHYKLKDEDILPHFKAALKGKAKKLFQCRMMEDKNKTYQAICKELKAHYENKINPNKARQRLYNAVKKKRESMEDFLIRMIDIVAATESDETETKNLNNIIVERLMKALPPTIYRALIDKKQDLNAMSVIPEALKLIRDFPDEKKHMKVMRGSKKEESDSSESSSSSSEEEEDDYKKKKGKDNKMKEILKQLMEKETETKIKQEKSEEKQDKAEETKKELEAIARELKDLTVNMISWQKQALLKKI